MPIHATTIVFNLVALPLLLQLLAPTYHHPHGQPRIQFANAHGFLSSPRSRNLVAFEDRKYYPITADDPQAEDCPNCLNHGGVLARCGVMGSGQGAMERNYDLPKNGTWDVL